MVLHRLELAGGHGGKRRELAVGREQPRVVGEAGAEEVDAVHHAARRRVLLALVGPAHLEVLRLLLGVGEVLLRPLDALLEQAVAGEDDLALARDPLAGGDLVSERAIRVVEKRLLRAERARPLLRPLYGDPQRLRPARRDAHAVARLPARALAGGAVVAPRRRRAVRRAD